MKNKIRLLLCFLLICAIVPINLTFADDPIDLAGDGIHIDDIVYYLSHTGSLSNSDIGNLLDQIAPIVPTPAPSAPSMPTNLVATAGDSHISLTWSSVTGATYYNVYQSPDDTIYHLISTPAITTTANYDVTGLTNGILYYFKTSAVNVVGESTYSNYVNATPIAPAPPTPTPLMTSDGIPVGYTFCGKEGETCSFSGKAWVAYGALNVYNYKPFTTSTSCSNGVFGDPIGGVVKSCYYLITTPTPAVGNNASITYNETWTFDNSSSDAPANYNGTRHYSNVTNAYSQYSFTGTSIKWIGEKGNNR